tara:strand:- start:224 stop:412 length:189 start_codon:yes stop_codon:yes gene_type:complete
MSDKKTNRVILQNIYNDLKLIKQDIFFIKNELKSIQGIIIQNQKEPVKDIQEEEYVEGWRLW